MDFGRLGTLKRANDDLLAAAVAAAAAAGGAIIRLNATDAPVSTAAVLAAASPAMTHLLAANAADGAQWSFAQLQQVLAAAPALRRLRVDARVDDSAHAQLLLSGAGAFAPLAIRTLHVSPSEPGWSAPALEELATGAARHGAHALHFFAMPSLGREPATLVALCAAAAAARLPALCFIMCALGPDAWAPVRARRRGAHASAVAVPLTRRACVPQLADVLAGGGLQSLGIVGDDVLRATSAQVAPFCAALRSAGGATLQRLHLEHATHGGALGSVTAGAGAVDIVAAAAGHPALKELRLAHCRGVAHLGPQLAAALSALAATPGGALQTLDIGHNRLDEAAIAPLLSALASPQCSLASLNLSGCRMTPAFEEGALAAAADAARTLRTLQVEDGHGSRASSRALDVGALVPRRSRAAAAAAAQPAPPTASQERLRV